MRIEIQEGRCSGCRLCQQICTITHFQELNPRKAAIRIEARFPAPGIYTPRICDQCGECGLVCPAEAITHEGGVVRIDSALCTLCESCVDACSRNLIHLPPEADAPVKCDLCLKCTEVCNTGALLARNEQHVTEEVPRCTVLAARPCA